MTALHKLTVMCGQAGAIPHLLGLQPQTPEGLLAHVMSGELLTAAQRDYVVRLTFLLALEGIAEAERLRQLVLGSLSPETAYVLAQSAGAAPGGNTESDIQPAARAGADRGPLLRESKKGEAPERVTDGASSPIPNPATAAS